MYVCVCVVFFGTLFGIGLKGHQRETTSLGYPYFGTHPRQLAAMGWLPTANPAGDFQADQADLCKGGKVLQAVSAGSRLDWLDSLVGHRITLAGCANGNSSTAG